MGALRRAWRLFRFGWGILGHASLAVQVLGWFGISAATAGGAWALAEAVPLPWAIIAAVIIALIAGNVIVGYIGGKRLEAMQLTPAEAIVAVTRPVPAAAVPPVPTPSAEPHLQLWNDVLFKAWQMEGFGGLGRGIDTIIAAARAGTITVWGRPEGSWRYQPIERFFWETAYIDPLKTMEDEYQGGFAATQPYIGARDPVEFVGLRMSQVDAAKIFPGILAFTGENEDQFFGPAPR